MTLSLKHINIRRKNWAGGAMKGLGNFWGIIAVILTIGSVSRFVVLKFYNLFIRGLSKRSHKGLISKTVNIVKVLEDDHGIFAAGGTIAIVFHGIIMTGSIGPSILGIVVVIAFTLVILTGIVHKFIYKDKEGKIKKYHIIFTLIYIVFLILHLKFT